MKEAFAFFQAVLTLMAFSSTALAQKPPGLPDNYPAKPVRVIIGSVPGGATDIMSRLVIPRIAERWGAPFVLENAPSALVAIKMYDSIRKSPGDGYYLMVTTSATVLNGTFVNKVPFDLNTAFATIGVLSVSPLMLGVTTSLPVSNVKEFVAYAKAHPGELNYGSSGVGSGAHLAGELLAYMAGVKLVHVPYKGAGPAIVDTIAGRVHLFFGSVISMDPNVKAGKLKTIGITSAQRMKSQPDLPTIAEQLPGFDYIDWIGLVGSPVTHPAIVQALNQEIHKVLRLPEVEKVLLTSGLEPVFPTPEQFRQMFADGNNKAQKLVKEVGLKLE